MAISSADSVLLRRSPQEPLMSLREPLARLLGTPMDDAAFQRLTISIARAGNLHAAGLIHNNGRMSISSSRPSTRRSPID